MRKLLTVTLITATAIGTLLCAHAVDLDSAQDIRSLYFQPNFGQWDTEIRFVCQWYDNDIVFMQNGMRISSGEGPQSLTVLFRDASPLSELEGMQRFHSSSPYPVGHESEIWYAVLPTFLKLRYHNIYPAVDLLYYEREGQLEYDIVVHPGGSVTDVAVHYEDAVEMWVDENGNLQVETVWGYVTERAPTAYQVINGQTNFVPVEFTIPDPYAPAVGFQIVAYSADHDLVID